MNTEQIRSKKTIIILLILLVIGIPLTVFLARKQQEIRSRAQGSGVQFMLSPQTATKNPGEIFSVDVNINAGGFSLAGLDTNLTIDKDIVDFVSFTPASTFDTVINNSYSPSSGTLRITAVNVATPPLTGTVKVGTLTLKAKAGTGTGAVTVHTDAQVVASGQETPLPINTSINGSYTIVNNPTGVPTAEPTPTQAPPTPTPTRVPTPTPTRRPTPTPTLSLSPTPTPNITPTPTPTSPPGTTAVNLTIGLDGIGITSRIPLGGNKNPLRKTRTLEVKIYKADDNSLVSSESQVFSFNSSTNRLDASIALPSSFGTGIYNIYALGNPFLTGRYPGSVTITKGQTTTLNSDSFNLITGDVNKNQDSINKLNILDYNVLVLCSVFTSDQSNCNQNPDYKINSDLNDNGVIDQDDLTLLIKEMGNQSGDILPGD